MAGLTQADVADACGTDRTTINKLEARAQGMSYERATRLAAALGITLSTALRRGLIERPAPRPRGTHEHTIARA